MRRVKNVENTSDVVQDVQQLQNTMKDVVEEVQIVERVKEEMIQDEVMVFTYQFNVNTKCYYTYFTHRGGYRGVLCMSWYKKLMWTVTAAVTVTVQMNLCMKYWRKLTNTDYWIIYINSEGWYVWSLS